MTHPSLSIDIPDGEIDALPDRALADARRLAREQFKRRGFPTLRDEDWKYTDLAAVADISERWLSAPAPSPAPDVGRIRALQSAIEASWLVIANGELIDELSTALADDDVEISRLAPDAATAQLEHPLSDLNMALLRQGIVVRITSDRSAAKPIGFLIVDSAETRPIASQTRIDIELTEAAAARFVECHISSGNDEHYSNVHINAVFAENARADYLRFQNRAQTHSQTARLNVTLAAHSHLHHCGIDLGGRLTRNDLDIDVGGVDATATFDGLYIAADGQHIDNHTRIDHSVGPAVSAQEYRGILYGRCRAVWNGKAIVHAGADGTDATQANHNLLLSEHAEINAKPELEIYADDVKCAHGTTVGQLDEAALFYLRSRGLDRDRAMRVLTRAFAASIVTKSPLSKLHEFIGDAVETRLRELTDGDRR